MSGWREAVRAKTPEEAARRRFGLWALGALIVFLPLWWWIGADLAAAVLRPVAAVVWGEIAPMLNPALATQPGGARLVGEPLNPMAAQIAIVGRYLALSVAPLVLAVVTWAAVNPEGRETLLGALGEAKAEEA